MSLTNYRNYGRLWRVYGRSVLRYGTPRKVLNALRTEWAYRRRDVDVPTPPYLLFLEPLYYCNLDCPLCDRQAFPEARRGRGEAGRLPLQVLDKILDEVGDYLFQCQIFGLGEPMLDWKLTRAIVERCHQRRLFTLVSTNCTLISDAMAEEIVQSPLDYLVCAIDGVSQAAYERYRVKGRVEEAMRGLERVLQAKRRPGNRGRGPFVEWQFLVHKHNEHEVDEARAIADRLGVYIRFSPLAGMEWEPELQPQWVAKTPRFESGLVAPGETRYPWHCYWLWRALVLNSNGQLARCQGFQNVSEYGSLLQHGVMELYNGPTTQRARQLFSPGPVPDGPFPSPCDGCAFYARHHGGPNRNKREAARVALPVLSAGAGVGS